MVVVWVVWGQTLAVVSLAVTVLVRKNYCQGCHWKEAQE
jgi:hypothetical protein